jgi:hypothetical protein
VLVVLGADDEIAYKSFRNLPEVHCVLAGELNAYDVLVSDWVVFTRATLPGPAPPTRAAASPPPRPRRPVVKDPRDVILAPVVSEKSYGLIDTNGVYTFTVHPDASKPEIRHAVQAIFGCGSPRSTP